MSMQNYFVLNSTQRTNSMSLDADGVAEVDPRAIDNASPGVGVNLNDNATGISAGATVTLTGGYILPKRIVDNPLYQDNCPNLLTFLLTLPWCSLEDETIFAPPPPL